MIIKYTIVGKTGRAQLQVRDLTGDSVPLNKRREYPDYSVRLLPRNAHRSASFAAAGDEAYSGTDFQVALLHIQAWTGLDKIELPAEIESYRAAAAG